MTEDNFKGLKIVPLNRSIHSCLRSTAAWDPHPFRGLYLNRHPPPDHSTRASVFNPPDEYKSDDQLIGPDPASPCEDKWQYRLDNVPEEQTVRLCDVEAFRNSTARKGLRCDVNRNSIAGLTGIDRVSISSTSIRPVIYRYVDVAKDSFAIMEAIHFELFMPDRSDLRFLGIQVESIPSNTVEGDYFHISDADLLSVPSFAVKLGEVEYPVFWEVKQVHRISSNDEQEGLAYMIKPARGGMIAVSDVVTEDLFIRQNIFPDGNSRNSIVRITFKKMWSTALIFPVEPVRTPHLEKEEQSKIIQSLSPEDLENVYKAYSQCKSNLMNHDEILKYLESRTGDQLMRILFKLGHSNLDPNSEYSKRIFGVRTSTQYMRGIVTKLRLLSATEAYWIEDRLGSFKQYGQPGDLEFMDQYFKLGSRFRNRVQAGLEKYDEDTVDTTINESLVLKTLMEEGRSLENSRALMNSIYDRNGSDISKRTAVLDSSAIETVKFKDGTILELNPAQSTAVRMYMDENGPRVFCVCSAPGSGKSTTAVAMAVITRLNEGRSSGVQLLSAQNAAVDNLGNLLKKIDFGKVEVEIYNMKTKKLNPHVITPYDLFDLMSSEELEKWMNEEAHVPDYDSYDKNMFTEKQKELEMKITERRNDFEKSVHPEIILATVEMCLHKKMNNSKLEKRLSNVKGIIIDEASLLTEASLYAIIRRFPQAKIVLIGDEHQLPPYQYEENILGQELAGRCALSEAMKNGNMRFVEMNEVYKASASIIAPYNRLTYDNKLISRKAEGEALLSKIGLVRDGRPQLLLIDVDGRENTEVINKKTTIVYNPIELEAVVSLLKKFPDEWIKDIMIICLYKGQKIKLDKILNGDTKTKQYNNLFTVNAAQGKEAPIVILLTTRTRPTPFFIDSKRCNVAVSRQQKALIILGKKKLLLERDPWKTVLDNGDFSEKPYFGHW